jgi:hypothetical protein
VIFGEWREERRLRRKAAAYTQTLHAEPREDDVAWLASAATGGDADRARWELRYARRALGLLVAQRDALDDRTGSAVAREILTALANDPNVGAGKARVAERQFNQRLRTYTDAIAARRAFGASGLALALMASAGVAVPPSEAELARGMAILDGYLAEANEALRRTFGVASLPENIPPSATLGEKA